MQRQPAKRFQDLIVWQKSHRFVLKVYQFSATFPAHETYGLRAQIRRASVSVPANIAEGFKKQSNADKARVLNIAEASLEEARYFLILARDLEYGDHPDLPEHAEEIARLLSAYRRTVRANAI
jgi:four helix bundle protein